LSSTDPAGALAFTARLSWLEYRAAYPWRIYLISALPRALLQVLFFAYLGYFTGGHAGRTFAFVGASAHVMLIATVIKGPDVLLDERVLGTLYRLRLGVLSVPAVIAVRWWVYAAEAIVDAVAVIVVAGPFVVGLDVVGRLLLALPLFGLVALTTSALGLAVAAVSLTQRADVLVTNLANYAALVVCGVVAPLSALGTVGMGLGRAIPLTHGLLAIRAAIDGRPWAGEALLEAAVGAAWAASAVVVLLVQEWRARAFGIGDRI
jgi:ABC-2 type transport system permease protein